MKKSRPGTLLRVMCREPDRDAMLSLLFRHTTTIGVRGGYAPYVLDRRLRNARETPCGPVRRKTSSGYGVRRAKYGV